MDDRQYKTEQEPKSAEHITLSTEIAGHAHDYMQVVIGLKGHVEFDVNGYRNRITPGQGCIVSPTSVHIFGGVDKPSDIFVLNVDLEHLHSVSVKDKVYRLSESDCYFGLSSQTVHLINLLASEVRTSPDDSLLCQSCSHTVLALLTKHSQPFQSYTHAGRLNIDVIDGYIARHLHRRVSVSQLAGSVFLSESQFFNQFKKQTGMTPHQYVLIKRINQAKHLLESSNYSLNHISDITGFSGQSAFTHAFSRYEGISPSQYKKRWN